MKARCMTTLPPGDQNEFVSAVPLPDTVSKSIQAFVQGSRSVRRSCDRWDEAITRQLSSLMGYWLRVEGSGET